MDRKEALIMKWLSKICDQTLASFQDCRDGVLLDGMLNKINAIEYRSIVGKSRGKTGLNAVVRKLECRFNVRLSDINVERAREGDKDEIIKIISLVLLAGALSDESSDYREPTESFESSEQEYLMDILKQALRPNMSYQERSMNYSFGSPSVNHGPNKYTESPCTHLMQPFSSPIPVNISLLSHFVSPSTHPLPLKSQTKIDKVCAKFTDAKCKLKVEKSIRFERESDLTMKDEVIEKQEEQIQRLECSLKEVEKSNECLLKLISSLRTAEIFSEQAMKSIKLKEKRRDREISDLKEINALLEKQNNKVFDEKNRLHEASSKQCSQLQHLNTQLQNDTHSILQLQEEVRQKTDQLEVLTLKLKELQKLHDEDTEFFNSKLQVMNERLNESINMDDGECMGDVVENIVKEEIAELQTSLQTQREEMQVVQTDNEARRTQVALLQLTLQESAQKQAEVERVICVLEGEKSALEGKVVLLEGLLSEEEASSQCLKKSFEEEEGRWREELKAAEERAVEKQAILKAVQIELPADKLQAKSTQDRLNKFNEKNILKRFQSAQQIYILNKNIENKCFDLEKSIQQKKDSEVTMFTKEENIAFSSKMLALETEILRMNRKNQILLESKKKDDEDRMKLMYQVAFLENKLLKCKLNFENLKKETKLWIPCYKRNEIKVKRQVEELSEVLRNTMVNHSKQFFQDANDSVVKWSEMGAELEQVQEKLRQVVVAGTLDEEASVFQSLQQARQLTDVFVQLFDLLYKSNYLLEEEVLKKKESRKKRCFHFRSSMK